MGFKGGRDFLFLRIETFVSIGFCTYSWLRRLKFCFQLHTKKNSIAADPPPSQSWKSFFFCFFRFFANILQYFQIELVFKIVQNGISNILDQKLPVATRHRHRRPPSHQNSKEMTDIHSGPNLNIGSLHEQKESNLWTNSNSEIRQC